MAAPRRSRRTLNAVTGHDALGSRGRSEHHHVFVQALSDKLEARVCGQFRHWKSVKFEGKQHETACECREAGGQTFLTPERCLDQPGSEALILDCPLRSSLVDVQIIEQDHLVAC